MTTGVYGGSRMKPGPKLEAKRRRQAANLAAKLAAVKPVPEVSAIEIRWPEPAKKPVVKRKRAVRPARKRAKR